ncbi:methyltransferase domain-containing protein [Salipaludibacillus sp. CUR1]|uniref:class I SAM-dependent methyltransferase n=1 Tax=Salipaludibacillus sp. CUR1 TaxID=2820003 RepID=UPI001E5090C3|nr:class I SAM-dependent methyltransferase [Salipaludibacillus sp. CUR1]MCE7791912.1 methyltransferase domain-containing protein [Salipaludibacillus sp. CUR1]
MKTYSYMDMLAAFKINFAHPGGGTLTNKLLEDLTIDSKSRVLDAGCGTGETARIIANTFHCAVDAIDAHSAMAEEAVKRSENNKKVNVQEASVENLPFQSDTFDLVLSESVLAFTDRKAALKELHRVLKKGGCLLINEMSVIHPIEDKEREKIQSFYGASSLFTVNDWINAIRGASFKHIELIEAKETGAYNEEEMDIPIPVNAEAALLDVLDAHMELTDRNRDKIGHAVILCQK